MMMLYGTDNTRENNPNNTGGQWVGPWQQMKPVWQQCLMYGLK